MVTRTKTAPVKSLAELAGMRDALRAAEEAAAIAQVRAALDAAQKERERNQFANAVGRVQAVKVAAKAHLPKPLPAPEPLQRMADEAAALKEALSDEVDLESLLLTDDGLSFRRPGVGPSTSSICTACAATRPARRWASSSAWPTKTASAACGWCMARAMARPANNRC